VPLNNRKLTNETELKTTEITFKYLWNPRNPNEIRSPNQTVSMRVQPRQSDIVYWFADKVGDRVALHFCVRFPQTRFIVKRTLSYTVECSREQNPCFEIEITSQNRRGVNERCRRTKTTTTRPFRVVKKMYFFSLLRTRNTSLIWKPPVGMTVIVYELTNNAGRSLAVWIDVGRLACDVLKFSVQTRMHDFTTSTVVIWKPTGFGHTFFLVRKRVYTYKMIAFIATLPELISL